MLRAFKRLGSGLHAVGSATEEQECGPSRIHMHKNGSSQIKSRDEESKQGSRKGVKNERKKFGSIQRDKEVKRSKVSNVNMKTDRKDKYKAAKYKTSLCKHFMSGYCRYEHSCVFAHGVEDLSIKQNRMKGPSIKADYDYEQQVCGVTINPRARTEGSHVRYGQKSLYKVEKYKTALCRHHVKGSCQYKEDCVFAHGVDELRVVRDHVHGRKGKDCNHNEQRASYGEGHEDNTRDSRSHSEQRDREFFGEIRESRGKQGRCQRCECCDT